MFNHLTAEAVNAFSMLVVVERPDGSTFTQLIPDDFYSLVEFKQSLGKSYWIVDLIDMKGE